MRSSGIFCACSTARSFSGCVPVTVAIDSRPSKKVTLIVSAPATTCRLVRITPLSTITTPVPTPRSSGSPGGASASGGLPRARLRPRFCVFASGVARSGP